MNGLAIWYPVTLVKISWKDFLMEKFDFSTETEQIKGILMGLLLWCIFI